MPDYKRLIRGKKPSKKLGQANLRPKKSIKSLVPLLLITVLIIGIFFLPKTPHIRWQYEYQQIGQERFYISCDYLGVRGTVTSYASNCPIIVFFEKSKS